MKLYLASFLLTLASAQNTVLAVDLPPTCASTYSDPHVLTFDGLKYDCQGGGDFILSKSMDSDFELQGRFYQQPGSNGGTVTDGAVLNTGKAGEPIIEVEATDESGQCVIKYTINGVEHNFGATEEVDGVQFFRRDKERYMYFPGSDVSFHVTKRENHVFKCFMDVKLCMGDDLKGERIIGVLGSPDGNSGNDFMTRTGERPAPYPQWWGQINDHCKSTWCIGAVKNSMFTNPDVNEQCVARVDDELENQVRNIDPEIEERCGGDVPCMVDAVVTGDIAVGEETLEVERRLEEAEVIPEEEEADKVEEDVPSQGPHEEKSLIEDQITKEDNATPRSFTKGDPHFKTHGGELYDFHGGCDLTLLDNPKFKEGLGMRVHIRTMIETWWSYVSSSAVQIGDETLEIAGGNQDEWLYINGIANEPLEENTWFKVEFSGLVLRYKQSGERREAHLYLGNGEKLFLKAYKEFVKVEMDAHGSKHYEGSLGLLGRFPDGKRIGPDGVTFIEDVNEFGLAWQVKEEDPKLFHTYEGAGIVPASNKCVMPMDTKQKTQLRKRRLESGIPMEEAEKACAHLESAADRKACVFDVTSTQDVDMASVW